MKKMIMMAVLAFSTNVFAQANKTVVFCDYAATPEEDSIFMDLYFDYDAATNTYSNLEVGFLNAANQGYPDYLYTVSASILPGATEATVTAAKDANSLTFALAAVEQNTNGTSVPAFLIGITDGKVNNFEVYAQGTFNGKPITSAPFSCYDPSLVAKAQQQAPR